jgi:ABC-2 type transport system permease protein
MNIFLFELKSNLKSNLIWILVLCSVAYFFMLIYPAFYANSTDLIEVFNRYPKEVLVAFGFDINQFFSAIGFYCFVLIYIELIAAMQAIVLGLGTSGRELRLRTTEFIITKPVKRLEIMFAKTASVFVILVLTNILLTIVSYIAISQVTLEPFSTNAFLLVCLSTFLLQCLFASLGILLGVTFRKLRSIAPVSLGIVFGFFVLNMLKAIFDDAWIRYFSPFQFFDKYSIVLLGKLEIEFLLWGITLIIGMILLAFVYFNKKDIHAV